MSHVIIIGAGAAGMMAGIQAARCGHKVTILEKNEKCGRKIYITGKGRCNLTNAGDMEDLKCAMVANEKFMFSAFNKFSNYDAMGFFDELGLEFKIERGNRVFPVSDRASDVIDCLLRELRRLNVDICFNSTVSKIKADKDGFKEIITSDGQRYSGDALIITTGGQSYPTTGSTGDGYNFAKSLGHTITKLSPGLVPFNTKEEYVRSLQGLSLRNVGVKIYDNDKLVYSDFGEMLFTHFGVSGPTLISASSKLTNLIEKNPQKLLIDLKPALDEKQLDERILRDFNMQPNKSFKNSLDNLYPKKMIPVIINLCRIDENKKVNEISKTERMQLIKITKGFPVTLLSLRGYNEAIITRGGVNVKEINPSTMESRLVSNVYFAGEVLDVDAITGGFNLQIAWSTGFVAGSSVR